MYNLEFIIFSGAGGSSNSEAGCNTKRRSTSLEFQTVPGRKKYRRYGRANNTIFINNERLLKANPSSIGGGKQMSPDN